jgi:hypothetical protein
MLHALLSLSFNTEDSTLLILQVRESCLLLRARKHRSTVHMQLSDAQEPSSQQ